MSTRIEEQTRADIVEAGRRMYSRGYVASNDGNISARLDETRILTTPKSVSKGFMTPDMMVVVDYEGKKLSGDRDPSSELPMHLEIYRNRPDVNAVVHAHPPIATGFAVAGIPLTESGAGRGGHDAGQYSDCRVRDTIDRGVAGRRAQVHQGARWTATRESWCR
jgi:L-ribulose-5-phosphate 4-epimerase